MSNSSAGLLCQVSCVMRPHPPMHILVNSRLHTELLPAWKSARSQQIAFIKLNVCLARGVWETWSERHGCTVAKVCFKEVAVKIVWGLSRLQGHTGSMFCDPTELSTYEHHVSMSDTSQSIYRYIYKVRFWVNSWIWENIELLFFFFRFFFPLRSTLIVHYQNYDNKDLLWYFFAPFLFFFRPHTAAHVRTWHNWSSLWKNPH